MMTAIRIDSMTHIEMLAEVLGESVEEAGARLARVSRGVMEIIEPPVVPAGAVIVSRHPGAIAMLRADPRFARAAEIAEATADDVRGRLVGGNLPLHLAAEAAEVVAVEFAGAPPRGTELDAAAMAAAGARLRSYRVTRA